jgi:hypothetical protein
MDVNLAGAMPAIMHQVLRTARTDVKIKALQLRKAQQLVPTVVVQGDP